MLTKKLVIAALLAAAHAAEEGEEGAKEEGAEGAKEEGAEEKAEGAEEKEEGAGEEKAEEKAEEKGEGEGKGGESDDDFDFERARKAWRKEDAEGKVLEVFCDQAEDALWEGAQEEWEELTEAAGIAAAAVEALQGGFDDAEKLAGDMKAAADAHRRGTGADVSVTVTEDGAEVTKEVGPNEAALLEAGLAEDLVAALVEASGGSSTTTAAGNTLAGLTQATTAAEGKVATQRDRVQALVTAKATQAAAVAAWGERATAAQTAVDDANTAKGTADTALADARALASERSYLYKVLGEFDAAQWAAGCEGNSQPSCGLSETARGSTSNSAPYSTSTWSWPANNRCNMNDNSVCQMKGLKDIIAAATTALGKARVDANTAPEGLYLALENADYEYDDGTNPTKLATCLARYLAWQKLELAAVAMDAACWGSKAAGTGGVYGSGDVISLCGSKNGITSNAIQYNPVMQGADNARSQAAIQIAADAEKAAGNSGANQVFGDYTTDATDEFITQPQRLAKAVAQVAVWYGTWRKTALESHLNSVIGDEDNKDSDGSWASRTIGTAMSNQATAEATWNALKKDQAAVGRWLAIATQEDTDADNDLTRAETLLGDLVMEIAPIARMESAARTALAEAEAADVARAEAADALGNDGTDGNPVTGAYAIRAAALAAKKSVDDQQAFHDAREAWAAAALAPVAKAYNAAVAARDGLTGEVAAALTGMQRAKEACKVAAFAKAQAAREAAAELATKKAETVAAVKKDYESKAAFATEGAVGALCPYPPLTAEGVQGDRPECAEGEPGKPLCCGAAQRFLKDGTKLSVETCQLRTTTAFKYYPALPADALVAPTPETWRFQCIGAAQKLAAAATAALAAGYMMA